MYATTITHNGWLTSGANQTKVAHSSTQTGHEIKKQFYISVPYFPGLSESYKQIFKYTAIQVCFKGVNTLKSMLMHSKDKISMDQKKDVV